MDLMNEPKPVPRTRAERRRQESVMLLHEPVPEMLQHLWQSKLLKQCPVDSAAEISAWPAGQVNPCSISQLLAHFIPSTCARRCSH